MALYKNINNFCYFYKERRVVDSGLLLRVVTLSTVENDIEYAMNFIDLRVLSAINCVTVMLDGVT